MKARFVVLAIGAFALPANALECGPYHQEEILTLELIDVSIDGSPVEDTSAYEGYVVELNAYTRDYETTSSVEFVASRDEEAGARYQHSSVSELYRVE